MSIDIDAEHNKRDAEDVASEEQHHLQVSLLA